MPGISTEKTLFELGGDTEDYDTEFWLDVANRLRAIVRSEKFRGDNDGEADALYSEAYERLTLTGCGIFWGYVQAWREYWNSDLL